MSYVMTGAIIFFVIVLLVVAKVMDGEEMDARED